MLKNPHLKRNLMPENICTRLAEKLKQSEYTMKCTVTGSAYDAEIKLTRAVSGSECLLDTAREQWQLWSYFS